MNAVTRSDPTIPSFDVSAVREWLHADRVVPAGRPSGGGYSGETRFLEVDGRPLVLRTAPSAQGMFAHHDLEVQVRCMRHVRAHDLPAPEIVAADLDGVVLGRPAYVMERVAGRVPPDDRPVFTQAGFLADATRAEQHTFGADLVDRLADLHQLPQLDGLPIGPAPEDHLTWCAAQLADPAIAPTPAMATFLDDAAMRLRASAAPVGSAPTLLWGDARPANTVVDGRFRVVAMLDWEMAGTGAPEFDVAWMNEMNRMRAGGTTPPLPGMPGDSEVWERWSTRTGRVPRDVGWHQRYAAYKIAVLMELHLAEQVRHGGLPVDHPLRTENRATRRLSALLAEEEDR